jgi:hypothetical protein
MKCDWKELVDYCEGELSDSIKLTLPHALRHIEQLLRQRQGLLAFLYWLAITDDTAEEMKAHAKSVYREHAEKAMAFDLRFMDYDFDEAILNPHEFQDN